MNNKLSPKMDISIVIPAYNEQDNLPILLENLLNLKLKNFEIIVVNDNSTDKTALIADSHSKKYYHIRVLHRQKGINGMGAALKDGTKIANGRYVVWVMGDNSDDLTTIPMFIEKLRNSNCDIVFGSRYIEGGSIGDMGLSKAMLSSGYTSIARLIFNFNVHDITNAFRAFKKGIFNNLRLEANNFAISPEFAIKAHLKGYKLCEVPTKYRNRKIGQTKFKFIKMGIAYCRLFKYWFAKHF